MTYFPGSPTTVTQGSVTFGESFYFPLHISLYRLGKKQNLAARSSLLAAARNNLGVK